MTEMVNKSNGNSCYLGTCGDEPCLIHQPDRRYDFHDKIAEVDRLKAQLAMFAEDNIRKVILDWKHSWMNQTQNSKEDYENYFKRAFGIDANMQYDLARKIAALAKLEKE